MTDRPILFSGPMVRAILEGRKTQTRRVIEPYESAPHPFNGTKAAPELVTVPVPARLGGFMPGPTFRLRFAPGDRLWVREAWRTSPAYDDLAPSQMGGEETIKYEADDALQAWGWDDHFDPGRFRPGMFMPRWASRLTLIVTDVRMQRLQDISEDDAVAEGCAARVGQTWWQGYRQMSDDPNIPLLHQHHSGESPPDWMIDPRPAGRSTWEDRSAAGAFRTLWDSLNAKRGYGWDANPWVCAVTFTAHHRNIDQMESA